MIPRAEQRARAATRTIQRAPPGYAFEVADLREADDQSVSSGSTREVPDRLGQPKPVAVAVGMATIAVTQDNHICLNTLWRYAARTNHK